MRRLRLRVVFLKRLTFPRWSLGKSYLRLSALILVGLLLLPQQLTRPVLFRLLLISSQNFSEFTNLFDQYRIVQVTVTFVPTSQVSTSSPLVTFIDRDDASTLTAVTQCYEFPSCQISESGCLVERTFTPRPATAAYSGVFTSFTSASAKIWIDAASAGVLYYGLKWYNTAQTGNNTSINWDIVINLTMQFQFVH